MPQKILILEDNNVHAQALMKIIQNLHRDLQVYYASDVKTAYQLALENHMHLFLVDIILDTHSPGDVSGLEFAKEIRGITKYKFTPLIFITSLEDPKLYSYSQLHCFGYIEKPFSIAQVRDTILGALEYPVKEDDDKYVYFRKEGIVYSAYVKDIVYIESSRRKIKIHCVNDELEIPYKTCEEMLKDLDSASFIQCSRYCIVNKRYIEQIDYTNRFIKLKYVDEQIEIGRIMQKELKKRLGNE